MGMKIMKTTHGYHGIGFLGALGDEGGYLLLFLFFYLGWSHTRRLAALPDG